MAHRHEVSHEEVVTDSAGTAPARPYPYTAPIIIGVLILVAVVLILFFAVFRGSGTTVRAPSTRQVPSTSSTTGPSSRGGTAPTTVNNNNGNSTVNNGSQQPASSP